MNKRRGYLIAIIIIFILFIVNSFSTIIDFITDYQWFQDLGYTKSFLTRVFTQFKIGIPTFIILFGIIYSYLMYIKKSYYKEFKVNPPEKGEKRLNIAFGLASALISLFASSIFAGNLWFNILQIINRTDFNITDPIFNKDLSFYIFSLPLIKDIIDLVILILLMLIILAIALYAFLFTFRKSSKDPYEKSKCI